MADPGGEGMRERHFHRLAAIFAREKNAAVSSLFV